MREKRWRLIDCLAEALERNNEEAWEELGGIMRTVFSNPSLVRNAQANGAEDKLDGMSEDLLKRFRSPTRKGDDPLTHFYKRHVADEIPDNGDDSALLEQFYRYLRALAAREIGKKIKSQEMLRDGDVDPSGIPDRTPLPDRTAQRDEEIEVGMKALKKTLAGLRPAQRTVIEVMLYPPLPPSPETLADILEAQRALDPSERLLDPAIHGQKELLGLIAAEPRNVHGRLPSEFVAHLCGTTPYSVDQHYCRFRKALRKEDDR